MSAVCGCDELTAGPANKAEKVKRPRWCDPGLVVSVLSGIAFGTDLTLEWSELHIVALVTSWVGPLLGMYTFVPDVTRNLVVKRKFEIALSVTINAVGVVVLSYVGGTAVLAFLYSIAEALKNKAMDHARGGLCVLLKLVLETATALRDGTSAPIPAREIAVGGVLLVRPDERIVTDGLIRSGRSNLNTPTITDEPVSIEVTPGEAVSVGAINNAGVLEVEATATGAGNSPTTIVELVEQVQAEKGDRAWIADWTTRLLASGVTVLAVLVGMLGLLLGSSKTWITRTLVVLVATSPCALAITVLVTVVSAIGTATKFGVVVKSGAISERLGGIRHLAMDETGTLIRNRPEVATIIAAHGLGDVQMLARVTAVEQHSTYPLAAAIAAAGRGAPIAQDMTEEAGCDIDDLADGHRVAVGSLCWVDAGPLKARVEDLEAEGQTCAPITVDNFLTGVIDARDELRLETPEVVRTPHDQGIEVSMLTDDNPHTAAALAKLAGVGNVYAELRPEDKARIVAGFSETPPTATIGGGINDASALAGVTVGIAMGVTGSDTAIESADVTFTGHDLGLTPQALRHACRGGKIINQNIVLSLAIITVLLPLVIIGVLGLAAAVLVHEVAEVVVIANGLWAAHARKQQVFRLMP